MLASLGLAFLAGMLTILSPCVLPLLPIVLATAASQSRFGPLALSAGVVMAFVAVGLFVALVGFSIGLDGDFFRTIAAVLLAMVGLILISKTLQNRFSLLAAPIANWGQKRLGSLAATGAAGQFGVGLLLGTVWSPCAGPTLGAASLLASQGKDLGHVIAVMVLFGLGVGVPLLAIGLASRKIVQTTRTPLLLAGQGFKVALGTILVSLSALIISGYDKAFEALLVAASPDWLTGLTTRF